MSEHRRQQGIRRAVVLLVLVAMRALGWQQRRLRRLRYRLEVSRRHGMVELVEEQVPGRRPVSHPRVLRQPELPERPRLSQQAVFAGRWAAETGPVTKRLRGLVVRLRGWCRRARWPVIQVAAATVVTLPMLAVPDVVIGDSPAPPDARSAAGIEGFRTDYPGFARSLFGSPRATGGGVVGDRADAAGDSGSGRDGATPGTGRAEAGQRPRTPRRHRVARRRRSGRGRTRRCRSLRTCSSPAARSRTRGW